MIWNQHLLYQIIDVWYHIRKLYLINNEKNDKIKLNHFFLQTAPHILDPLNETDLFCLLYVYLPRLNKNLAEFVSAHNNHKISTEGNNTPAQIFWTNLHLTALGEGRDPNDAWMGVNINELASTNLPHVQVPPTSNPLHDTEYEELQRLVDLLTSTCGKELYRRTVDFVGRKLSIHWHLSLLFTFLFPPFFVFLEVKKYM